MTDFEPYFRELIAGKRRKAADRALYLVLQGAAWLYALILRGRAAGYALGLLPSRRLPRPVISVGNLTLGGTGKTPAVVWLARYLLARGKRVAVLSRGYGGSAEGEVHIVSDGRTLFLSPQEAGDEPCLLAEKVPGLMVVIGADRYRAGLLALERLQPDLFLLDDGFQHLKLKRDLNILLLDAATPFANGHTLPAGMLRESPSAAGRADLVVYTRSQTAAPDREGVPGVPCLASRHILTGLRPLAAGARVDFGALKGARVLAFSGIAHPDGFFDSLEREGVALTATLAFPDHVRYGEAEIAAIVRLKTASRAAFLITTEKDAVKLSDHLSALAACYVAEMEMTFADSLPLETLLEKSVRFVKES